MSAQSTPLASRNAYRQELADLADHDPRIVCMEADLGGHNHPFATRHPDRFFNVGIAEAAMIDMAVSLAEAGFRPFVSTFAPFATLRAAESVKLGMAYHGAPVALVAPYAGMSGAWLGGTHHCLEDFAIIQSMPGIALAAPYGEDETRAVIRNAISSGKPHYVRVGRNEAYRSLGSPSSAVDRIRWVHRSPGPTCLLSVGEKGTELTLRAQEQLTTVSHAHACYVDYHSLAEAAPELGAAADTIVVVEEHRPAGSVGSTLALLMPDHKVRSFNVGNSWVSTAGTHNDLLDSTGFNVGGLIDLVMRHDAKPVTQCTSANLLVSEG